MKKVSAVAAVMILVWTGLASASNTRVIGLGIPVWMVPDEYTITTIYVGQLTNFKNQAFMEYGFAAAGDEWGGVNLDLGTGALGIYINDGNDVLGSIAGLNVIGGNGVGTTLDPQAIVPVNNQFNLAYAIDLSGMILGAGVTFGTSSASEEAMMAGDDKSAASSSNIGLLLGLSMEGNILLDFALHLGMPMIHNTGTIFDVNDAEIGIENINSGGAMNFGLAGRMGFGTLTVNASFGMEMAKLSSDVKYDTDGSGDYTSTGDTNQEMTNSADAMNITCGLSKLIQASDSLGIIIGGEVQIGNLSSEIEAKDNLLADPRIQDNTTKDFNIILPLTVAVEGELSEIWTVRGGIGQSLLIMTSSATTDRMFDPAAETSASSLTAGTTQITLGLSGIVGDFTIDTILAQAILFNGPYLISGAPSAGLFTNVALKYTW